MRPVKPEELSGLFELAIHRGFIKIAHKVRSKAKTKYAPEITGNLRRSIVDPQITAQGVYPMRAKLPAQATYSAAVHEETKPHDIYPVNAKALYWPGAAHPVKVVHHPGTKPNPFFQYAIEDVEQNELDECIAGGFRTVFS